MKRESWKSRAGFIFAAVGSAVGLANIWKFPYTAGASGGAAFVAVYLLCLLLIGFPVFIAEVIIGRSTKSSPRGALRQLGGNRFWSGAGLLMVFTGFLVSSFYSAIAGQILGYLVEAVRGNLTSFHNAGETLAFHETLMANPWWGTAFHFLFLALCTGVLFFGVRAGIERGNEVFMPLLILVLLALVGKGLLMPGSWQGIQFLFSPDWSAITPAVFLTALGQSFFTLSLGQGTMITYGSYLDDDTNIPSSCLPIILMDTLISLLAAVAIFTIVFSVGMRPDAGPGLLFHTLPLVFSQIPGGYLVALLFFLLVVLAALTSQISAMEPFVAYLMDEKGWSRHWAVAACGSGAFLLGIPSALSASLLREVTLFGMSFFELVAFVATEILIPLGGFLAVVLVGWKLGMGPTLEKLEQGTNGLFHRRPWVRHYFFFGIKYSAPILVLLVFLRELGVF